MAFFETRGSKRLGEYLSTFAAENGVPGAAGILLGTVAGVAAPAVGRVRVTAAVGAPVRAHAERDDVPDAAVAATAGAAR